MSGIGIAKKGLGIVLKQLKKPGKAFERAGDKWYKKTRELQTSKKKSEKIRGNLRIVAPLGVAGTAGGVLGVKDAKEEIRKRGVYGVGRKDVGAKSLLKDIKSGLKKVKEKITKK